MKTQRTLEKEMRKPSARTLQDDLLAELAIPSKLEAWNTFTESVSLPAGVAAALITGRPELLKAVPATEFDAEQIKLLLHGMAVLVETNRALQLHAERTAQLVQTWSEAFKQLETLGQRITAFANFRDIDRDN